MYSNCWGDSRDTMNVSMCPSWALEPPEIVRASLAQSVAIGAGPVKGHRGPGTGTPMTFRPEIQISEVVG